MNQVSSTGRRLPWVGILVTVGILIAVVGFGVCKRKGARKPPPIPEETVLLEPAPVLDDSSPDSFAPIRGAVRDRARL